MPYKSDAQRKFMHAQHPKIAKKWDAEISSKKGGKVGKVYRTGTPVAHKNMSLDPTGYINREMNKGNKAQPSTRRSGLAKMSLRRAAQRRLEAQKRAPKPRGL
jgi:hypothetical protein